MTARRLSAEGQSSSRPLLYETLVKPEDSKDRIKHTMHDHPRTDTRSAPTYFEEARLLTEGFSMVAGVDEAGRGPLAGPVVAGVAVLPPNPEWDWVALVRDSKQIGHAQREYVYSRLRNEALGIATGAASHREIDELGIVPATRLAMMRAIGSLPLQPQFLLLDAISLPNLEIPQKSIVHGDARCLSIAAASIVAKVTRDGIMQKQDSLYPGYGFTRHKGYATREHLQNLTTLGPCPIHRRSFAPVRDWGKRT